MVYQLKQSTAFKIPFFMTDSTDGVSGKTGLSPTATLSKDGGAFGAAGGSVTEIGNGWYYLSANTTDTNTLGALILRGVATGAIDGFAEGQVKVAMTDDIYSRIGAPTGASLAADLQAVDDFIDTEVAAILAAVDTEVAAIKAKTDNLPSDPADASDIASSHASISSKIDAVDDLVDTEVAAIKTVVDAIKLKTDLLPASPAAMVWKKNTEKIITFFMFDDDGNLATGLTVTATRSLDSGTFASCSNSVTEIGGGKYQLVATATELNTTETSFLFVATGCRTTPVTVYTEV